MTTSNRPAPMPGPEVIRTIRQETDTVLLSFSCGKDSIAAWLAVRDEFPHIVPFYLELIPGLSFVEESLTYFEQWFGCHILRLPHPSLYRMLNNLVWQPPERCAIIEAAHLPNFSYDQLAEQIVLDQELPASTFVLSGVRAVDSPNRMTSMKMHGPINWTRRMAYPIWDMNKAGLVASLEAARIALPVDYEWFGRSFDGLDYRFLSIIKEQSPEDYQLILDWFPLAELELYRHESL